MEDTSQRQPFPPRVLTLLELPLVSISATTSESGNNFSDDLHSNATMDDDGTGTMQNVVLESFSASLTNRGIALDFFNFALADLQWDCLVFSFLPLPNEMYTNLPAHALAPSPDSRLLNMEEVNRCASWRQVAVGACILGDEDEKEAARSILNQLCFFRTLRIFVVLLMPGGKDPSQQEVDAVMREHDDLINMGVSEVLIQPELSPGKLEDSVRLMSVAHAHKVNRMDTVLKELPRKASSRQIKALVKQEQSLIWETIPRLLMPEFLQIDQGLLESDVAVGPYHFQSEHQCISGRVLAATSEGEERVAVKVITKAQVHSGFELEQILRECHFLREFDHPNIARCLRVLQTPKNIYLVCEDAGDQSLEEYCAVQHRKRLGEESVMHCLTQIADGLAWMHGMHVSHRQVSLHHVVVKQQDPLHFSLVDFRCAVVARDHEQSNMVCGTLPCIAPEVAFGEDYYPRHADSWSLGVLLLEIAGGLTSLIKSAEPFIQERRHEPRLGAVTYEEMLQGLQDLDLIDSKLHEYWHSLPRAAILEDRLAIMDGIVIFFEDGPASHEMALGLLGGVTSPRVLFYLEKLLLLIPEYRMSMQDLFRSLTRDS